MKIAMGLKSKSGIQRLINGLIERGFIKAEVIKYSDLIKFGSEKKVKDAGLSKLQGKEYIVEDGDCIYFHFNI